MRPLRVGACQFTPSDDVQANIHRISDWARRAADQGVQFLVLPEFATCLSGKLDAMRSAAAQHECIHRGIARLATESGMWIHLGSYVVPAASGKLLNRAVVFDADGAQRACYDKLHLFDATLTNGRRIRESGAYERGNEAVVVDSPWGLMGVTTCFDLRFPGLYRALAQAGARLMLVPAAFTRGTGAMHWEPLLRARAIETTAFIVAAAACGDSPGGRENYGHSMVVSPWGAVLSSLQKAEGLLVQDIDLKDAVSARMSMPTVDIDVRFAIRHR